MVPSVCALRIPASIKKNTRNHLKSPRICRIVGAMSVEVDKKQALRTREVANRMAVSMDTVRAWIRKGKLRAFRTPGGGQRVAEEEMRRFEEARDERS